jgi:hypothetical protein
MSTSYLTDQCALNADGSLKDASEINWVHDPDDKIPTASSSGAGLTGSFNLHF